MIRLDFTIDGTPQQQGSKRVLRGRAVEANKNLTSWRVDAITTIRAAIADKPGFPTGEPVQVKVTFTYARPRSHYGTGRNAGILKPSAPVWKTSAADLDKLERALGDVLTQSGCLIDDALIVDWQARKVWGDHACTQVSVQPVWTAATNPC